MIQNVTHWLGQSVQEYSIVSSMSMSIVYRVRDLLIFEIEIETEPKPTAKLWYWIFDKSTKC
jgi:hypothetical protein